MSTRNSHPDRDEKQREAAVLIALRTGLLKKCPRHGEVYDPGQHDYQGACMVATFLINGDDPLVASFEGEREPLLALLRSICKTHPVCCAACSKQPA